MLGRESDSAARVMARGERAIGKHHADCRSSSAER
jgi:hypothetical protein